MSSGRQGYVAVRAVVVRQELSGGRYVFGVGIDVDTEVFPAAHLHRFGVTDCRIIIQIQGDAIIPNRSLTNCYFCTRVCHTV